MPTSAHNCPLLAVLMPHSVRFARPSVQSFIRGPRNLDAASVKLHPFKFQLTPCDFKVTPILFRRSPYIVLSMSRKEMCDTCRNLWSSASVFGRWLSLQCLQECISCHTGILKFVEQSHKLASHDDSVCEPFSRFACGTVGHPEAYEPRVLQLHLG